MNHKIVEFAPGIAEGMLMEPIGGTLDNLQFVPWTITHMSFTAGMCKGNSDLVLPLGSDDGKNFRIIFGLRLNGRNVDVRRLFGESMENIYKAFEELLENGHSDLIAYC